MTASDAQPALDPPTGLAGAVITEQATPNPACGHVQSDVPANVCVRDAGHQGPHVATVDGDLLQFAE